MTDTLILIVFILSFVFAATLLARRNLHIFQLNSYKPAVHKKWVKDNVPEVIFKTVWIFATVPLILNIERWGYLAASAIYLAVGFLNLPRKAKKPFVVTNRIKRLIAAEFLLAGALVTLFILFAEFRSFFAMMFAVATIGAPYIMLLANFICKPIEGAINLGFIKDAKRILADMPDLKIIGITGSYGKTSVKFYLGKLLSAKYNVLVTPESYNTTLGVVRTIRENLRATHEVFVCEMGARNPGDIKEICDIVKPAYGIITAIGPQHLESFGTVEKVAETKFELINALPDDGIAFLNTDNEFIAKEKVAVKTVAYGTGKQEYAAKNIGVSENGSSFTIRETDFTTKLIGRHNVMNIAGAVAVAHTMGVPMDELAVQVRKLEGVPHRLQLLGGGNRIVIDDAFNSNPEGAKAALETLGMFKGFKILVTPGMVELGGKQVSLNYELGQQAAEVCDHVVLIGQRQTSPIYAGLLVSKFPREKITITETLNEGLKAADSVDTGGKTRIMLLENDLPDNY